MKGVVLITYIENPFLEGQENEKTELRFLYNKNFRGLDMKYIYNVIAYYCKNNYPPGLKRILNSITNGMLDLMIYEYTRDINKKTGKINTHSSLSNGQEVVAFRSALENISIHRDEINREILNKS